MKVRTIVNWFQLHVPNWFLKHRKFLDWLSIQCSGRPHGMKLLRDIID